MPHEAYCVAYRNSRWSVFHQGRELGAFHFRTRALQFAVSSASRRDVRAYKNVYVHDRDGSFYTAWNSTSDQLTLYS